MDRFTLARLNAAFQRCETANNRMDHIEDYPGNFLCELWGVPEEMINRHRAEFALWAAEECEKARAEFESL